MVYSRTMLSISVFIKVVFTFWLRLGLNPVEQYVLNSLLSLGASQLFKALRLKPGATQSKPAYAGSPILIFRSPRRRTKVGVATPFRVMGTLKTRPNPFPAREGG